MDEYTTKKVKKRTREQNKKYTDAKKRKKNAPVIKSVNRIAQIITGNSNIKFEGKDCLPHKQNYFELLSWLLELI